MNISSSSNTYFASNKNTNIKYSSENYNNNSYEKTSKYNNYYMDNLITSVETIKDCNGQISYKEYYLPSKDIKNQYNIYRKENGQKYTISSAEKTKSGNSIIEKTFTNDIGILTNYLHIQSPNGNRLTYTKIKDKDDNILLDSKKQFKVIDDTRFQSIENGNKYDIEYFEDKVKVKKNNNEEVEIIIGDNNKKTKGILSKDALPKLKMMSGSTYFEIKNIEGNKLNKIGINVEDDDEAEGNTGMYYPFANIISMGEDFVEDDDLFGLYHELGHYKDDSLQIRKDKELLKTYREERDYFVDNRHEDEIIAMEYFINYRDEARGLGELIAETNAILNTSNNDENIRLRVEYLQKNFPETFARAATLLLR